MHPAYKKLFRLGAPFLAFMVVGSYGLTYFTDIRYWVSRNKKRFSTIDPGKPIKVKTLKEIYEEEIAGKTFDDWEIVRAPRPWEPGTIRANEDKARKDRQKRAFEKLKQIEDRAAAASTSQDKE